MKLPKYELLGIPGLINVFLGALIINILISLGTGWFIAISMMTITQLVFIKTYEYIRRKINEKQ